MPSRLWSSESISLRDGLGASCMKRVRVERTLHDVMQGEFSHFYSACDADVLLSASQRLAHRHRMVKAMDFDAPQIPKFMFPEREVVDTGLRNNIHHVVFLGERGRGHSPSVIVFVSCALHFVELLGTAEWCAKRSSPKVTLGDRAQPRNMAMARALSSAWFRPEVAQLEVGRWTYLQEVFPVDRTLNTQRTIATKNKTKPQSVAPDTLFILGSCHSLPHNLTRLSVSGTHPCQNVRWRQFCRKRLHLKTGMGPRRTHNGPQGKSYLLRTDGMTGPSSLSLSRGWEEKMSAIVKRLTLRNIGACAGTGQDEEGT